MNLISGKYLNCDIWAFGGVGNWLVVYDGKYNYLLFDATDNEVMRLYLRIPSAMPCNSIGHKHVEFYTNFDNACNNLMRVILNDGFE